MPYHGSATRLIEDFLRIYAHRYGETAVPELAGFELVTFVVAARGRLRRPTLAQMPSGPRSSRARLGVRRAYDPIAGAFVPTPVFDGDQLRPGNVLDGPAVIEYPTTTRTLRSGQRAELNALLGVEIARAG